MNYSKRPIETTATSPLLFETEQDPDPTHKHTHTHTDARTLKPVKNGVTGFHGAMRLTDRAGVLTRSQTNREDDGGKEEKDRREGERGRGTERESIKINKGGVE